MTRMIAMGSVLTALTPTLVLAAGGGEDRGLVNPLIWEMVWSLVLFVMFFIALSVLVWPKILKSLQDREGKIKGDLDSAEQAANKAEETLKEYQERLAAAADESRKIIDKGRADAEIIAAQLKEQAQTDLTQMKKRAEDEIEAAKQRALGELYAQTATLATQVAGRILGKELSVDDQKGLVDEALAQYKAGQDN